MLACQDAQSARPSKSDSKITGNDKAIPKSALPNRTIVNKFWIVDLHAVVQGAHQNLSQSTLKRRSRSSVALHCRSPSRGSTCWSIRRLRVDAQCMEITLKRIVLCFKCFRAALHDLSASVIRVSVQKSALHRPDIEALSCTCVMAGRHGDVPTVWSLLAGIDKKNALPLNVACDVVSCELAGSRLLDRLRKSEPHPAKDR